jgi:hypothetical protein
MNRCHAPQGRAWALATLMACAASSTWSDAPPAAPLRLTGPGPYYQLSLPLSWQAQSRQGQLADVRLLNAQGDALPYAWVGMPDSAAVEQHTRLPLFRWDGPKAPATSASAPRPVASPSSPSWPIWVIDLRQVQGAVRHLHLRLPEQPSGLFAVAVESSTDLQTWTTVRDAAQLTALSHEGHVLRQDDIELPGTQAPYLRMRLLPGSPAPDLTDVDVITTADVATTPAWSWSTPISPSSCSALACDYAVPEHVPLARLKVLLTEANTLLDLQVAAKASAPSSAAMSSARRHHHPLRDRLHAIRDKGREDDDEDRPTSPPDDWVELTRGQVHWIQRPEAQQRSDELPLPPSAHQVLRLSSPGGDAGWTRHPPAIQVATWSRALVFLARGPQPYRLGWAAPTAPSTALSMAQLMPPIAGQAAPEWGQAALEVSLEATKPSAPSRAPTDTPSSLPRAWVLWAVLLLGVALMAYMARSLFVSKQK